VTLWLKNGGDAREQRVVYGWHNQMPSHHFPVSLCLSTLTLRAVPQSFMYCNVSRGAHNRVVLVPFSDLEVILVTSNLVHWLPHVVLALYNFSPN
jgi:hypothetical protein